jgi:hypothetical protein
VSPTRKNLYAGILYENAECERAGDSEFEDEEPESESESNGEGEGE